MAQTLSKKKKTAKLLRKRVREKKTFLAFKKQVATGGCSPARTCLADCTLAGSCERQSS